MAKYRITVIPVGKPETVIISHCSPKIHTLQGLLMGTDETYLEMLQLGGEDRLWMDEDGKLKMQPVNDTATKIACTRVRRGIVIAGNAVMVERIYGQ